MNWRCLRTSHATRLLQAGANVKDVQGQMRHARTSATMDIYAQIPESQQRALGNMMAMVATKQAAKAVAAAPSHAVN